MNKGGVAKRFFLCDVWTMAALCESPLTIIKKVAFFET